MPIDAVSVTQLRTLGPHARTLGSVPGPNGTTLGRLTPDMIPHTERNRHEILLVLNNTALDPTGSTPSTPAFDYMLLPQNTRREEANAWGTSYPINPRSLPRASTLAPPKALSSLTNPSDVRDAYISYRIAVTAALRQSIRAGADLDSLLSSWTAAMHTGDQTAQRGLRLSLSSISSSPILAADPILALAVCIQICDTAFDCDSQLGPRAEFTKLARGWGDTLILLAHQLTHLAQRLHPSLNASTLWHDKHAREEIYEKFCTCVEEDTHPERQHYCKRLAAHCRKWLRGAVLRAEVSSSEGVFLNLAHAVTTEFVPHENMLAAAYQSRRRDSRRDDAPRHPPSRNRAAAAYFTEAAPAYDDYEDDYDDDDDGSLPQPVHAVQPAQPSGARPPPKLRREDPGRHASDAQGAPHIRPPPPPRAADKAQPAEKAAATTYAPKIGEAKFVDLRRLIDLGKQGCIPAVNAYPSEASRRNICETYPKRSAEERRANTWPALSCRMCAYTIGAEDNGAHNPFTCPAFRRYLANTPTLQSCLVHEFPDNTRRARPEDKNEKGNPPRRQDANPNAARNRPGSFTPHNGLATRPPTHPQGHASRT